MQLRRFTAESTPAALGAVRLALGDDAIILANRKIGDQVEIIATANMEDAEALARVSVSDVKVAPEQTSATSNDNDSNQLSEPVQDSVPRISAKQNHLDERRVDTGTADLLGSSSDSLKVGLNESLTIEQLKSAIDEVEKRTELKKSKPASANECQLDTNSTQRELVSESDRNGFVDAESGETQSNEISTAATVLSAEDVGISVRDEMDTLMARVGDMISVHADQLAQISESQNQLINQHFKGLEVNLWGNNAPHRREHLQQLISLGLGAELAVQLVERALPETSVDEALRQSFALLKSTLPIGSDKSSLVPGVTVVSGAPGAGKTTVLMKLATQHVKEHGAESVVIICADTRRIGAFEELQAYGRLLGVPTVHAHDTAEFESLIAAFNHKQLVLVDHTLPMDQDAVELPNSLTKPELDDSVRQLFVLSAISQSSTVESLLERNCQNKKMQCVLTHLDANARLGEMFNPIIRHHLPIAYWSDTASIQTPLQKADASILIATAVAMSRRLTRTADDEYLIRLIQPTDSVLLSPTHSTEITEVIAK